MSSAVCSARASIRRNPGAWRVVGREVPEARRGGLPRHRLIGQHGSTRCRFQLRAMDRAGPQQHRRGSMRAVDDGRLASMPQAPPSRISRSGPNSPCTWAAVVDRHGRTGWHWALPAPSRPARGRACSKACATGWSGQRSPIESWPPAAAAPTPGRRGRISVKGPGQNACIRPGHRAAHRRQSARRRPRPCRGRRHARSGDGRPAAPWR